MEERRRKAFAPSKSRKKSPTSGLEVISTSCSGARSVMASAPLLVCGVPTAKYWASAVSVQSQCHYHLSLRQVAFPLQGVESKAERCYKRQPPLGQVPFPTQVGVVLLQGQHRHCGHQ
ncbi:uncharacterized protein [Nothobranchius furzeri]|uniref:uncharacterized protein isoform X2 n=1 Tax=Nothobranchius furzeri TaxID=105023 RepID=UPI00390494BF